MGNIEVSFNLDKKHFYIFLGGIFIVFGIILVNAYTFPTNFWGHGGDRIWIRSTDNTEKTLQAAITQGDFEGPQLSYFKPTDVLTREWTTDTTVDLQGSNGFNNNNLKSCLLTKFKEKILTSISTCDVYQDSLNSNHWTLKVTNAECGVVCISWVPDPYA